MQPSIDTSTTSPSSHRIQFQGKKWLVTLIVLVCGLLITAATTLFMKSSVDTIAKQEFISDSNGISDVIINRLDDHARILKSGVAFFNASEIVSRKKWRAFTQSQRFEKQLPGIQGIGFSLVIPHNELSRHIEKIRREGFPEYNLRPVGDRPVYSSIIYLEPFSGRNLQAFGYDMLSESVRRAAMERARDTDTVSLSGKVVLVQETRADVQAGTLMYAPVYRKDMPTETVEQRQAAIYGWVYSPYRMNDLLQGILNSGNHLELAKRLHLEVFDGEQPSQQGLLYESLHTDGQKLRQDVRFTRQVPVDFNGQRWTLRFTQTGSGFSSMAYHQVWLTICSGIVITLLLCVLIYTLQHARLTAQQMVEVRTSELQLITERLFLASRAGGVGIWDYDVVNNKLVWDDQMFCLYGVAKEQFGGAYEAWQARLHPEDRQRGDEEIQLALQGEKEFNTEFRVIWPDGTIRYIRALSIVLRDSSGQPIRMIGTNWDISNQKRSEELLLLERQRLQNIIEGTNAGTWEWNVQTGETVFNEHWAKFIGYTLEEISPTSIETWMKFAHSDDLKTSGELLKKHFNGELNYYECECRMKHKDGHWVWVLDRGRVFSWTENGKPLMMSGTHQDISNRKQSEEHIRVSEERLSAIMDNSESVVYMKDTQSKYITVNHRFEELFKVSLSEVMGKTDYDIFPADMATAFQENDSKVLKLGKPLSIEEIALHDDGPHTYVSVKFPLLDTDGKPYAVCGISNDITDHKKSEELIARSLKEKEALIREIHHRVKNNMAVVSSLLYLQAANIKDDAVKKLFEDSQQRVKSMALVHEKLYQTKDLSSINFKDYITSILSEIISLYRTDAGAITTDLNIESIELDLETAVPCGLIINELLTNAFKYAFRDKSGGILSVHFTKADDTCTLAVKDNGIGLPEGFDYKNATTLGLQLVNGLTGQLGGTFQIKSDKGMEAIVTFKLKGK